MIKLECINPYFDVCRIIKYEAINNKKLIKSNPQNGSFETRFHIFPKYSLITEYQQKYRMDWLELLYNIGGTIGIWWGWSALSLPSIIYLIKMILGMLNEKIILIFGKIEDFYISLRYERNRIGNIVGMLLFKLLICEICFLFNVC